jgi:ubiquinone/menaquinone biosynthesis C-methylase UbiE
MDKYYDIISGSYDGLYKEEQLNKLSVVFEHIKINPSDLLLDVGCGTGFSLNKVSCFKVGVDPSIELLKQSKHNRICAKAESLPFSDDTFDIVISITAIQNFDDLNEGLKEMKRVGKSRFVLTALKKSDKMGLIDDLIKLHFDVRKVIEEEKDIIYVI